MTLKGLCIISYLVKRNKKETMYIAQWLIEAFDAFYWRNYDKWKVVIVKHDEFKMSSY